MEKLEKLQKKLAEQKAKVAKQKADFKISHKAFEQFEKEFNKISFNDEMAESDIDDTYCDIEVIENEIKALKREKAFLKTFRLPNACAKHPAYAGLNKPTGNCPECKTIHASMQVLLNGPTGKSLLDINRNNNRGYAMKFSIGIVLSITHKTLLAEMSDMYTILNYMLDEDLYTHQLPRAAVFCGPFIRNQYPMLDEWDEPGEGQVTDMNWKEYVEKAEQMFGEELDIDKVPSGVWERKDPMEELLEMMNGDDSKIIKFDMTPKMPDINLN